MNNDVALFLGGLTAIVIVALIIAVRWFKDDAAQWHKAYQQAMDAKQ